MGKPASKRLPETTAQRWEELSLKAMLFFCLKAHHADLQHSLNDLGRADSAFRTQKDYLDYVIRRMHIVPPLDKQWGFDIAIKRLNFGLKALSENSGLETGKQPSSQTYTPCYQELFDQLIDHAERFVETHYHGKQHWQMRKDLSRHMAAVKRNYTHMAKTGKSQKDEHNQFLLSFTAIHASAAIICLSKERNFGWQFLYHSLKFADFHHRQYQHKQSNHPTP